MAIPSTPPVLPIPIADSGDVRSIPEQTPIGTNQLSFQSGFPPITSNPLTAGGIPPQREDFNAFMKLVTQHLFYQQSGSVYPWNSALNYLSGGRVIGANGDEYRAQKSSGPDITSGGVIVGPKDPVSDAGDYWKSSSPYELCEFYAFRHPTIKPGFMPAQGGVIENAATQYPAAWAYLQTAEGQLLCKTEAEWQAMTTAIWATLADGTTVGWNGIGGAPFYAPNMATGALRLPDIRGMYMEAAGFDEPLDVGGVHGDMIRNITGSFLAGAITNPTGAFHLAEPGAAPYTQGPLNQRALLDPSRVVPVGNANKPRAFGVLPCVYLGTPK